MQRISFFVATIILLFPMTIGAVPQLLNHQGYTADNQGTPISGSANTTFNLYSEETGGESIWAQTVSVTFDGGYYSVVLGPGTPELSIEIFDGSDLYLGITLEGQNEFLPRMKIASVPYSFRAGAVEGEVKAVGGLVVDGVEVIDSNHQWVGLNISFNDLDDIPSDLADGDDLGLEGSGTDGTLAQFTESGVGDSVIVQSDGKVGVGTDPQSTFHVAGGLQIADDSGDCVEGKAGTIRWHESALEVCDGSEWGSISANPMGQSQGLAGTTCKTILDAGASQGNGVYWIDPNEGDTNDAFQVFCDMSLNDGGWTIFARIYEENDHSKYGFDTVDNGWAMDSDTLVSIEGVSFDEMIFIRRDNNQFYHVALPSTITWPQWGSHANAGNGYTISENPDHSGQFIRAYDDDAGKHYQLCFMDTHNDECGPNEASDPNNYGDGGGNDDQNMLWNGAEVNAIGTGITWDFGIR